MGTGLNAVASVKSEGWVLLQTGPSVELLSGTWPDRRLKLLKVVVQNRIAEGVTPLQYELIITEKAIHNN